MKIQLVAIPTKIARPGMSVGEALRECAEKNVPGIPFKDAAGNFTGRFSIRHTFLLYCIPPDIIQGAHLLDDHIDELEFPRVRAEEMMARTVDDFIFPDVIRLAPSFQAIKALAIMEHFNTEYLFVMDGDDYQGVVTRMSIARAIVDKMCCEV
jgi:predicted transcriptional regulator